MKILTIGIWPRRPKIGSARPVAVPTTVPAAPFRPVFPKRLVRVARSIWACTWGGLASNAAPGVASTRPAPPIAAAVLTINGRADLREHEEHNFLPCLDM